MELKEYIFNAVILVFSTLGGFILIFKGLLQKSIENMIDNASKKVLLEFEDNLTRKIKAYEMVLNKEFEFYEKTTRYVSNLVVNIQDVTQSLLTTSEDFDSENIRKYFMNILTDIPDYKDDLLSIKPFISDEIYTASFDLIVYLQSQIETISSYIEEKVINNLDSSSVEIINDIERNTLMYCSNVTYNIEQRIFDITK